MFNPPRCPYRHCTFHLASDGDSSWYIRHGRYQPLCRPHPVPRFRCLGCRRTFSRQTFRMDYRDHRPDLNAKLFELLASGVGLRQSSRLLGLSRRCLEFKSRKIGRHLRRLHLNLQRPLPAGSILQFDELETFEGMRTLRPLTVPLLIEKHSRYIVWAEAAPIPARHRKTRHGKQRSEELRRTGRRRDGSRRACRRTLGRAAALARNLTSLGIETDEKRSYPALIQEALGRERKIYHGTTKSTRMRDISNPLFAINQTEAIARDLMGRLRRQSWLVSKKRRYLDLALALFMAWRNLVRRRFNHEEHSPAQELGFTTRRMSEEELCSWRQDWGRQSIHPLAWNAESIECCAERRLLRAT
jgi:transposase-like protein